MYASRRPVVEAAIPQESTDLGAGHEPERSVPAGHLEAPARQPSNELLAFTLNGGVAMVALAAAFAAGRRRRRELTDGVAHAQVIRLPRPAPDRHVRRAA